MATTLTTLYPPQVDTFMPSFCYNSSAKVWFNISSYDKDKIDSDSIKYIHISMVDQRNNINVFAGENNGNVVFPQYYPISFNGETEDNNNLNNEMGYDSNKQMYWLMIPPQILKTAPYYNPGQYYKVQLRFDLTGSTGYAANNGYINPTQYFNLSGSTVTADALGLASYTNENQDNFSEWSTGTLIKPILIPEFKQNPEKFNSNSQNVTQVFPSTNELIVGSINFIKTNGDTNEYSLETEKLSWYQIKILQNSEIYYDSEKIYPETENVINYRIDMSTLEINNTYQMQLIYETNNGYSEIINYNIQIINYESNTDVEINWVPNEENGTITLNFSNIEYNNGSLIIKRSSHRSNFKKWDLIAAYDISQINNNFSIIDKTIESMTGYKYQVQYINDQTIYSPTYTDILHCDFYGGLFSDKDKTLKVSFNFQPSNRTSAMNRTKVDTLGGQYPIFTQNSKLKYHTYSVSGRISTEDNGELFLSKEDAFGLSTDSNSYYNYRYKPAATAPHTHKCQSIKSNQDWLYEREYRDAVEEWLNNGKPKLFRSMTEGNIIVMLDNVTMTPDQALGRRLYDFNTTMYEIGDGKDLSSIASFGLFEIKDDRNTVY